MQFPISRLTKLLFQPSFSTKVAGHRLNCFCFPTQPSCHLWQRRFALKGCAWTIRERVEIKGTKISSKKGYQPVHISPIFTSSASYHPPPFILPNSISSNFIIFYYFILFYFYFLFFIFIFLFFWPFLFFENSAFREPHNSPKLRFLPYSPLFNHVFHHSCFFHAFRPFCFHLWSCCRISKTRLSINEASIGCQRIWLV